MTSATLLHVLSAHRRLLLAGALLGVLLAALVALFVPPTYDSTTSIYVTARASGDDPTSAYQGTLLSQDRIASYRALATSHRVLVPVVEQQGRAEPAEDLAGRISVTAAPESTVLSLTVSGPDPVQDAETANAVAGRLVAVVGELERSARSGVQLETVDPARPAVRPSSPGLATTAPVAAVAGLIVAAGVALVRHTTDRRVGHRLPALSGAPLLGRLPVHPRRARDGSLLGSPEVTDGARRLRTAVTARGGNRAVLAMASAVRGEGRTTTALALAAAFAGTERVAVVEADLRNPGIAGLLGLPPTGVWPRSSRAGRRSGTRCCGGTRPGSTYWWPAAPVPGSGPIFRARPWPGCWRCCVSATTWCSSTAPRSGSPPRRSSWPASPTVSCWRAAPTPPTPTS
ncbi:YveK family protein [Pseudonocardia sp. ICBG1142]|uniref:YveK family protein n=1 Tax=Pseudonocardia sp. ICBG1142 TaxID=2846760 RepID=UPI001CF647B4|nr:Wzz/FepE/Etk N-terminal domain-containing protein [Pseudonocardia sp. ICBG1142]